MQRYDDRTEKARPGTERTRREIEGGSFRTTSLDLSRHLGPPPHPLDASAVGSLERGVVLAGRYRILGPLGRGGMGEVYRAEDLKLGQPVGLKLLTAMAQGRPGRRERLLEEVRIARRISHPNICRVHDIGEAQGRLFLSMECVEGEDLAALVKKNGRLAVERAAEIGQQICRGVAAAHELGILHRDLKPSNIMLDHHGEIRILDFGLAGLAEEIHGSDVRSGTPAYMAPEQHSGKEVTARSDLYALGLVLYELFTGQRAFIGGSREELVRLHREEQPKPPSQWVEHLPPEIERTILRCLEKDPRDRPTSALVVAAALSGTEDGDALLKTLVSFDPDTESCEAASESSTPNSGVELARHGRELMERLDGRKIEGADGHLLLFNRPIQAVLWALGYREAFASADRHGAPPRIGIHLGEVIYSVDPARRGPRSEIGEPEERARETLSQLRLAAAHGQILLTRAAFDLARSSAVEDGGGVRWLAHGSYEISGIDEPFEIFEVGAQGIAPLSAPGETQHVRRQMVQETITGWRPAPGLDLPKRPGWVIERKLGEGGFGEVWLAFSASQQERRVFKFCYEAESLRALQREITLFRLLKETLGDRRDITRIFDWSFEEAPYFIEAEYTEGGSLVDWAAARGGLHTVPLEARLDLVAQTASALAAAHSVGVLHKDVKPSNVLVTEEDVGVAQAKLSDFGIGRVTEHQRLVEAGITARGMTEDLMSGLLEPSTGTRLYMAPEVLEGKPATVQADVYALGIFLYQMVVGDMHRALGPGWEREVADELLAEDIAAAVDRSPEHRLGDAAQLASRLRELEARRDVRARRRREREEARRTKLALEGARRRRKVFAAVMAFLVILAGSMWVQSRRTAAEAERANREAETARQVSDLLTDIFRVADPSEARGEEITAREILDAGASKIDTELANEPRIRTRMTHVIGEVYMNLGLYSTAAKLFERAVDERSKLYGTDHLEVAESLNALALAFMSTGAVEQAREIADQGLEIRQMHLGENSLEVAESLETQAASFINVGDFATAESIYRRAMMLRRTQEEEESLEMAETLHQLGSLHLARNDLVTAQGLYRDSLEIRRRMLIEPHPAIARSLSSLALVLDRRGEIGAAVDLYRRALGMRRQLYGDSHTAVAGTLRRLAIMAQAQGNHQEAGRLIGEALANYREHLGPESSQVASSRTYLGRILQEQGDLFGAESELREALRIYRKTLRDQHPAIGGALQYLGLVLHLSGKLEEAERVYREAREIYQASLGESSPHTAEIFRDLAWLLTDRGSLKEAERLVGQAIEVFSTLNEPEDRFRIASARSVLGGCLVARGEVAPAETLLLEAYEVLKERPNVEGWNLTATLERLKALYQSRGELEKAQTFADRLGNI